MTRRQLKELKRACRPYDVDIITCGSYFFCRGRGDSRYFFMFYCCPEVESVYMDFKNPDRHEIVLGYNIAVVRTMLRELGFRRRG